MCLIIAPTDVWCTLYVLFRLLLFGSRFEEHQREEPSKRALARVSEHDHPYDKPCPRYGVNSSIQTVCAPRRRNLSAREAAGATDASHSRRFVPTRSMDYGIRFLRSRSVACSEFKASRFKPMNAQRTRVLVELQEVGSVRYKNGSQVPSAPQLASICNFC